MADSLRERRAEVLDAAFGVFARYGFKKTSMDELARAAGLSRPGLYLYFASKESLFQASVGHLLDRCLTNARAALAETAHPLDERLVNAFAAVHAPYIGRGGVGQHTAELFEAAGQLAGDKIGEHERDVHAAIVAALVAALARPDAPLLAEALDMLSIGAKHSVATVDEYLAKMRRLVPVVLGRAG